MLRSEALSRPPRSDPSGFDDQQEQNKYEETRSGLDDASSGMGVSKSQSRLTRSSMHTSYQSEDPSQSTVFTIVNRQYQPSMTTINTGVHDHENSNHNTFERERYEKSQNILVDSSEAPSEGSNKFRTLQHTMREELNNNCRPSTKRNRRFMGGTRVSSLGPAKRNLSMTLNTDSGSFLHVENSQMNSSLLNEDVDISRPDNELSNSSNNSGSGYKHYDHNIFLEISNQHHSSPAPDENLDPFTSKTNYENIEFGELNPYQYLKKHNLPSNELPNISRVYFERQREENRKSVLRKVSSGTAAFKKESTQARNLQMTRQPRRKINITQDRNLNSELPYPLNTAKTFTDALGKYPSKREALSQLDINGNASIQDVKKQKQHLDSSTADIQKSTFVHRNPPSPEVKQIRNVELREPIKTTVEVIPLKSEQLGPKPKNRSTNYDNLTNSTASHLVPSVKVNGTTYEKVELLGKGGSGKVYKVRSSDNKIYALKRVAFDEFDESSIQGFKGEIELLQKLEHQERVVKLIDYQMGQGILFLLMECGDHDLSLVLSQRSKMSFDMEFVRYHFQEMLKCVKVVHDSEIVHSDLKPANFVFVKGMLKIIDFGIANVVPDHTVNIYRDNQIGTPNYMAPETLVAMNFTRNDGEQAKWKLGKPADVWSCGCILYQMVYGKPPYATFQGNNRLYAIMNAEVKIPYPEKDPCGKVIPRTVIDTMKCCLERNPISRFSVDELLSGPLINPITVTKFFIHDLIKNAVHYGCEQKQVNNDRVDELAEDVWNKLIEFKL